MSMDLSDIQRSLADGFFGGDMTIAGAAIFAFAVAMIFAIFGRKQIFVPFMGMVPVTMLFTMMSLIPTSLAIIVALVSVLIIAAKGKESL